MNRLQALVLLVGVSLFLAVAMVILQHTETRMCNAGKAEHSQSQIQNYCKP